MTSPIEEKNRESILPNGLKSAFHLLDRKYLDGRLSLLRYCSSLSEYRRLLSANENPVVIGGCARSGTTLLLSLLSAHPNIYAIPRETKALSPDAYPAESSVDLTAPFYIDFIYLYLLQGQFCSRSQERWCEKTPMNVHFAEQLIDYFGDGFRFINLVRDGRAVVTSRHPVEPDEYWVPAERWERDVAAGRRVENHPQVLTVRYEDLTTDYRSALLEICSFIDEPYAETFDSYPETATIHKSGAWFKDASEVENRAPRRWEKEEHQEVIEDLLNRKKAVGHLQHYGYLEDG